MNAKRNRRWLGCIVAMAGVTLGAGLTRAVWAADPVKDPYDLSQYDRVIDAADRDHWAYRPIARPPVPRVKQPQWCANPIDCFILSRLETAGWTPNSGAEPRALLRRVFLDVVGLPPSPADQQTFLADSSPEGWSRLVDRLLDDPGYGERWGRHWLDLVRYAESNGYERDAEKPSVWRYRDWVIDSLNSDKPYNRFVLEQLAGDELPEANAETIIATGFNRLGPWDDEPADPAEDRFDQLDDLVRTTSQAFLGLTLGCARCHNHKFDALTQHDYYRLVAVFSPLQRPRNGRRRARLCRPSCGTMRRLSRGKFLDRRVESRAAAGVRRPSRRACREVIFCMSQLPRQAAGHSSPAPRTGQCTGADRGGGRAGRARTAPANFRAAGWAHESTADLFCKMAGR